MARLVWFEDRSSLEYARNGSHLQPRFMLKISFRETRQSQSERSRRHPPVWMQSRHDL